jgi:hypothetical protein
VTLQVCQLLQTTWILCVSTALITVWLQHIHTYFHQTTDHPLTFQQALYIWNGHPLILIMYDINHLHLHYMEVYITSWKTVPLTFSYTIFLTSYYVILIICSAWLYSNAQNVLLGAGQGYRISKETIKALDEKHPTIHVWQYITKIQHTINHIHWDSPLIIQTKYNSLNNNNNTGFDNPAGGKAFKFMYMKKLIKDIFLTSSMHPQNCVNVCLPSYHLVFSAYGPMSYHTVIITNIS